MIFVDETIPVGELPSPFPSKNVVVNFEDDVRDHYELKKEIGRGRFGTVYLVNCNKTGVKFAAKFVNTKRNQDRQNVEREIEVMKILNQDRPHPKLIQLYDAFDMGKEMCLILEVVDGGELFERVIDDDFVLTEKACAIFIRQICEGVEYIHSKNVLHLDMKPENILCLSRNGNRIKICDFGLARFYDPRKKLQVLFGTPEFVAPEVVNFEPISFGTDMWSVGVICYVLLSGLSPFMGHNYVETMTNVTHNKYDFDDEVFDEISDEAKDFIEKLLILEKSERLTPDQCIRHRWIKKMLIEKPIEAQVTVKGPICNQSTINVTNIMLQSTNDVDINANPSILPSNTILNSKENNNISNTNSTIIETSCDPIKKDHNLNGGQSSVNITENNSSKLEISFKSEENSSINYNQVESTSNNYDHSIDKTFGSNQADSFSSMELLHSERKRKERESDEIELETSKKQMKEFVDKWRSNSSSPYIIENKSANPVSEKPENITTQLQNIPSPIPEKSNIICINTKNITDNENICAEYKQNIAGELNEKLLALENENVESRINVEKIGEYQHIEISSTSSNKAESQSTLKGFLKRQDAVQEKSNDSKLEKEHSIKMKPSRDVPFIPHDRKDGVSYDFTQSVSSNPVNRRSRRSSREEPSFSDKDMTNYRRPSRDVPMSLAQKSVLHSKFPGSKENNRATTQEIWPDIICISQDKDSDIDYNVQPVTVKLELPLGIPTPESISESNKTGPTKKNMEKAKSLDDTGLIALENKNVKWVMDLTSAEQICSTIEAKMEESKEPEKKQDKNDVNELIPENKYTSTDKTKVNTREYSPMQKSSEIMKKSSSMMNSDTKESESSTQFNGAAVRQKHAVRDQEMKTICVDKLKDNVEMQEKFGTNTVILKEPEKNETDNDYSKIKEIKDYSNISGRSCVDSKKITETKENTKQNKDSLKISADISDKARQIPPDRSTSKNIVTTISSINASINNADDKEKFSVTGKDKPIIEKASEQSNLSSQINTEAKNKKEGNRCKTAESSLKPQMSNEDLSISTPWGVMRKSPSRNNLKSPERNVIMINLSEAPVPNKKEIKRAKSPAFIGNANKNEKESKIKHKNEETTNVLVENKCANNPKFKSFEVPIKINTNYINNKENKSSSTLPANEKLKTKKTKDKELSVTSNDEIKDAKNEKNINGYSLVNSKKKNFSTNTLNTSLKRKEKFEKFIAEHDVKDSVIKIDISYEEMFGKINFMKTKDSSKQFSDTASQNIKYKAEENSVSSITKTKPTVEYISKNISHASDSIDHNSRDIQTTSNIEENIIKDTLITKIYSQISKEHIAKNGALINELIAQNFSSEEINYVLAMAANQPSKDSNSKRDIDENKSNLIPENTKLVTVNDKISHSESLGSHCFNENKFKTVESSKSPAIAEKLSKDSKPPADPSKRKETEFSSEKSHTLPRGLKSSTTVKSSLDKSLVNSRISPDVNREGKIENSKSHHKRERDKSVSNKCETIQPEKADLSKSDRLYRNSVTHSESKSGLSSKRNSMSDSDREDNFNPLRRNSRSSASPSKNSFRMSLYTAQDRISLFEQKKDNPPRAPVPITKSRTSVCLENPESVDYQGLPLTNTRV